MDGGGDRPVAVVCAALNLEYEAARAHLPGPFTEVVRGGTRYETSVHGPWEVVLALVGRENTGAAVQVERALAAFGPQLLLLVGIAGGRRDSRHGDVIAASVIYDYEAGRDADGEFFSRAKSLPAAHRLVQAAQAVSREGQWRRRIQPPPVSEPRAFVAPLAAGGKVVTGVASRTAMLIDQRCDDARGVETEGYGVLHAAYVNKGVDAMVIRGVSDLLGDKTAGNDARWQVVAAGHAAAFAWELLDRTDPDVPAKREAAGVNGGETNIGIQGSGNSGNTIGSVGHVEGDVHVTAAIAPDNRLRAETRLLLALLAEHEREIGTADDEYTDAVDDIRGAAEGKEVRRGRLRSALRSVLGFAGGIVAVHEVAQRILALTESE
ncbi:phosphorylase [Phytomonospora sp. NPDC050363]|uniref:5'-methylthioadenosine/S-adenosylhomocysteine nucleosidase family protein n=1 Tax=Phytomonospora sp. NPDC050363 TaxID=3155642 RepID=UPI003406018B